MGVIYGLEVARTLGPRHRRRRLGRRGRPLRLVPRQPVVLRPADRSRRSTSAPTATTGIAAARGAAPGGVRRPSARRRSIPARYRGYLEAHIEQGDDLEDHHLRIGVVTAIVGSRRFRIPFKGEQNHAGTTRMAMRRDAGVALVKLVAAIEARFPQVAGPRTVWTTGDIKLDPGAASIVPGGPRWCSSSAIPTRRCWTLWTQTLDELLAEAAKGPCEVTVAYRSTTAPSAMDPGFQGALTAAAQRHAPGLHQPMPSRRRPRCADPGADAAVGDAVRAQHRRHQPSLCRKYPRRGHRPGLPGVRRRGSVDSRQR